MGEVWRDQGRMKEKMNTFTDFIACAEYLIREKYTSANRLAIEGGSAGVAEARRQIARPLPIGGSGSSIAR